MDKNGINFSIGNKSTVNVTLGCPVCERGKLLNTKEREERTRNYIFCCDKCNARYTIQTRHSYNRKSVDMEMIIVSKDAGTEIKDRNYTFKIKINPTT